MAYISLVRSVLEYSSSIWDPYHAKDISSTERIQRRPARFVKSNYRTTSSVTAMINDLGWKDLAHRRRDLRLVLLHTSKVAYDHIAVSTDSLGLLPGDKRLRSSHKKNFKYLPTNTDTFRYSFVPRTIIEWNSLPASAVECTSPESFKTQLARVKWDWPPGPCAHTPSALILLQEVCGLRLKTRQGIKKLTAALVSKIGVFSQFSWSLDFGAKMAEFPFLQIWQSRKRIAIQIQLRNIHVSEDSECKYHCLNLVPKFGNVHDRQNWRLYPTADGWHCWQNMPNF